MLKSTSSSIGEWAGGEGDDNRQSSADWNVVPCVSALNSICKRYALEPGLPRLVMFLQVYEQGLLGKTVYMSELAEMMNMPLSTLSKQLNRLSRSQANDSKAGKSLLVQSNDPQDRRRVCLAITLHGAEMLRETGNAAKKKALTV